MSEPNVEAVIKAAEQAPTPAAPAPAKAKAQPAAPAEPVDPRVADLVAKGMTEEDAQRLVSDLARMWR